MNGAAPLVDAIERMVQAKKQRQQQEQIRKLLPMLRAGKGMEEAFGSMRQDTGPKGLAGILDRLNPFAPHRGTSGLEELYAQKGIESQFTSPFGKPPWHASPEYRDTERGRIAGGIEPRAGRGKPERTEADILKEIAVIYKQGFPEGSAERQLQDIRLAELKNELAELRGMEIEEQPGTPGKKSWLPFGWGDVPEGPATEKLMPKKVRPGLDALADSLTGKDVPEEYRKMGVTEYRPPTAKKPKPKGPDLSRPDPYMMPIPPFDIVWENLSMDDHAKIYEALATNKLTPEDLQVIKKKLEENPENIHEILEIIEQL